jgi:hypothetical protein
MRGMDRDIHPIKAYSGPAYINWAIQVGGRSHPDRGDMFIAGNQPDSWNSGGVACSSIRSEY